MSEILDLLPSALLRLIAATALALYFTPILRAAAIAHDIVDKPDGRLKLQGAPVAYLGGLAIFLAFLITLGIFESFVGKTQVFQGLLLGASIILLIGVVDDMKAISPAVKFLGQLLAAFVLLRSGIRIEIGFLVDRYPLIADALTVLWIVGITNAFNIIDVMDGLAAGTGAIALVFLFVVALWSGSPHFAMFAVCLLGALLGFLRFNSHPATIYLGDAGSMLIGFLVASLTMLLSYTEHNSLAVCAPLLILIIPLFDTALVMVLRARKGIPVFRGSPDHFAVRLKKSGVPVRRIVLSAYAVSITCGVAALILIRLDRFSSLVLLATVLLVAIASGVAIAGTGSEPPPQTPVKPPPQDESPPSAVERPAS